jgi:hypothetical protein
MGWMGIIGVDKKQHAVKIRQPAVFESKMVYAIATISGLRS